MKIIIFLLALAFLAFCFIPKATSDAKRGCIASAYQAERNGFNLEENLKTCTHL